ncbi:MAG: Lrp/AsnC family transcriptional regulator [Promethearchaeota archaeon]
MVQILSFMKVELGKALEVVEELKKIPQVKEMSYITGDYDLVMRIEGESSEVLHKLFINKLDKIEAVREMNSHLLVKHWTSK